MDDFPDGCASFSIFLCSKTAYHSNSEAGLGAAVAMSEDRVMLAKNELASTG